MSFPFPCSISSKYVKSDGGSIPLSPTDRSFFVADAIPSLPSNGLLTHLRISLDRIFDELTIVAILLTRLNACMEDILFDLVLVSRHTLRKS